MEDICSIGNLAQCFVNMGAERELAQFIALLLSVVATATVPLITVILLIYIERKIAARVQDRIGPNRVGPFGLLQPVADAIKLLIKEDITPLGADKLIYNLAPIIAFASIVLLWAVIPYTPEHVGADLGIGVLYFMAVGSIVTVKVMVGGWASNNKYALLGAFRTIAQLLSYEVPLVLALIVPVMIAGTLRMQGLIEAQQGMWFVFMSPIAALTFFIANLAEVGRAPFDLIEAESEIVAGYNIEYSGFKFGMFMAGEFIHAFTICVLTAVIFLGGWSGPFAHEAPVLGFIYIGLKTAAVYVFMLVLRSTVPRIRIDQVMAFNWKFLVPLSIVNLLSIATVLFVARALGLNPPPELATDFVANLPRTILLLLANLPAIALALNIIRRWSRHQRQLEGRGLAARHPEPAALTLPAGD